MTFRTYAMGMARRLRNWTYREVTTFLKEHGFEFQQPLKGFHQGWVKSGETNEPGGRVEVHIPRDSYQPKTLKSMIRQSGIDEAEWLKVRWILKSVAIKIIVWSQKSRNSQQVRQFATRIQRGQLVQNFIPSSRYASLKVTTSIFNPVYEI